LIDDDGRLFLIKRTKPGQAPYWTTPSGGVEDTDESVEAALQRELAEELGVEASGAARVFLFSSTSDAGIAVQHFFVARLKKLHESGRSGPESLDASRGAYDLDLCVPKTCATWADARPSAWSRVWRRAAGAGRAGVR
jgi:ADP-ribose pyrophosphatase YjhB (NUDIX family)